MKLTGALVLLLVASFDVRAAEIRQPPSPDQAALMARFIVNEANYTSIATLSVRQDSLNYPYVSLLSLSDGPLEKGSGVPYVFITPLGAPGRDLEKDERATMMMSLVQGEWCAYKNYDPLDPRCARATFVGKMKKIGKDDSEYEVAKAAIYERHPWLSYMPANHKFHFAKMEIETVVVLAKFGGAAHVTPDEYYNADEEVLANYSQLYK